MNYIDLINSFWAVSEEKDFTPNDISTYFAVLKYCNSLQWHNPFVCHWEILIQYSKTSKNSFYKSLDNLSNAGLIRFERGQRNSAKKPKVFVLEMKNKKGTIKEQSGNNGGTTGEQSGNLYKLLNNETIKLIEDSPKEVNDNLKEFAPKKSDRKSFIPSFQEFKNYFIDNGYMESVAERAYKLYATSIEDTPKAKYWKDSRGTPIKNWKMKVQSVWFRPENKIKKPTPNGKEYKLNFTPNR